MPATGREIERRAFLLAASGAVLRAGPREEVYELFGMMANTLAEGNATPFLHAFDPKMPGYRELEANVTALVEQADVHSAIDMVEASGDEREQAVELDWLLQLTAKQSSSDVVRRQQIVKCRLVKPKRDWRVIW